MIFDEERETRQDVCEECVNLKRMQPLTCSLVKREKQIGPLPCPHALRDMLYDVDAECPHLDAAWAARWKAADVLQSAQTAQEQTAQPATLQTTATSTGSSCAAKTAAREVNPEAINNRARERQRRRRGTRHEAFYVPKHPTRSMADT